MGLNDYRFKTVWQIKAPADRIYEILSCPERYKEWVHGFSILVEPIQAGDSNGVGRADRFTVKGHLPYKLSWELRCIEAARPHFFTSLASGDLEGRGSWIFKEDGFGTQVIFDWQITARKPFLRYTAFILKPIFKQNHDWVMTRWKADLERVLGYRQ